MQWRAGTVIEQVRHWPGAVECTVALDDAPDPPVRALAYTAMVGAPRPGERVLLNASALLRGLGTGGLAFVVARPDDLPADPPSGPGHIVKARYTPMQQMLLAVDEQDSPHHAELAEADDLGGMPVVVADLHSALPAVLAGIRAVHPGARVAYVMTDGGALPVAFSRAVAGLADAGWLAATVTVGQAFGGDHEAVTTHTGLLAARHVVGADVDGRGPGARQRRHGNPVGLLRRGVRRRPARRRRARRALAWRRCASRVPTGASGTAASATTAARHTAAPC